MKTIKVDKVILYYMDRVDPDGNLYRFYVYKGKTLYQRPLLLNRLVRNKGLCDSIE